MTVVEGKRDEMVAILLAGVSGMPGCLSYIVATDPADANAIWITEAWDSKASHDASLDAAIREGSHRQGPAADCRLRARQRHHAGGRPRPCPRQRPLSRTKPVGRPGPVLLDAAPR